MSDAQYSYARKKAVNVSVNSDLLRQAKDLKLNLSKTLEAALTEAVQRERRAAWVAENREAIDAYNEHVEKDGVFSDGLRRF